MIYIIWAIPGGGKSYFGTKIALDEMLKRNPKKVFSNYPIIHRQKPFFLWRLINLIPKITIENTKSSYIKKINKKKITITKREPLKDKIYSSYIWKDEYIYTGLYNSILILDEAYRDFSSKESPKFSKDKHTFFATNRHNDLDIYVIAQHPARVEVIIREMCNVFYFVSKWINPLTKNPLWFTVDGYLSEEDFKLRRLKTDMRYSRNRIRFTKKVANAYDTHYFRKETKIIPVRWSDVNLETYFTVNKEDKEKNEIEKWIKG